MSSKNIVITGSAGFIGSHLSELLLNNGGFVIGIDNFHDYYDPKLKQANTDSLKTFPNYTGYNADIRDKDAINKIFAENQPVDIIIHLAAIPGVKMSIQSPAEYFDVNVNGTVTVLEACRTHGVKRVIFGSSSSVYGNNQNVTFSETDRADYPISPYAASKRAAELICYTYNHIYDINIAIVRFFTVYGPRQRPDLAIHKFTRLVDENGIIPVFNNGKCCRDYTYIDDITQGLKRIMENDFVGYDIINLGESDTTSTLDIIRLIESALGKTAKIEKLPPQPGDVDHTHANISHAQAAYGYMPEVHIEEGIKRFVDWYKASKN